MPVPEKEHNDMEKKYFKAGFEKITEEKRERILTVAAAEFAKNGFSVANINKIAKKAGISIGSMYDYFSSKEDLFLTVADYGYQILEKIIFDIDLQAGDIFDKIELLLRTAQKYTKKYPELNQIYVDVTSEGLSHLSVMLSRKVETIAAKFYRSMIVEAKKSGLVDPDIDESFAALCIDNLILMLQYSYTTKYLRERTKIFVGENVLDEDEKMIQNTLYFIRKALSPTL